MKQHDEHIQSSRSPGLQRTLGGLKCVARGATEDQVAAGRDRKRTSRTQQGIRSLKRQERTENLIQAFHIEAFDKKTTIRKTSYGCYEGRGAAQFLTASLPKQADPAFTH